MQPSRNCKLGKTMQLLSQSPPCRLSAQVRCMATQNIAHARWGLSAYMMNCSRPTGSQSSQNDSSRDHCTPRPQDTTSHRRKPVHQGCSSATVAQPRFDENQRSCQGANCLETQLLLAPLSVSGHLKASTLQTAALLVTAAVKRNVPS